MFEIIVIGIVLFGMYILNGTAVIPLMTGLSAAAVFAAAALVFAVKKNSARAKDLGLKAAVLAVLCGAIYGTAYLNQGKAIRGAERIAAACESYKAKYGSYPEIIGKLIPEYIKSIPRAKFTVMLAHYRLKSHRVMYVLDPWVMMAGYYDLNLKKTGFAPMAEMFRSEEQIRGSRSGPSI